MRRRPSRRRRSRRRARRTRRKRLGLLLAACLLAGALIQCTTPAERPDGAGSEPGPRAYRSLPVDHPTPAGRIRPVNHDVDWLERHGAVARADANDCASCHQEEDCASCHVENLSEPFAVHPPNYETIHAVDARLDQNNCTDCHKVETFCASCHARTDVSAIEPDTPPARVEFHPPGWLDATNPANHGVAARRNITECASCHQEQDCVTCHQGINPHPPEFRLNCSNWLEADPRPCAKCHGDLGALRRLCL